MFEKWEAFSFSLCGMWVSKMEMMKQILETREEAELSLVTPGRVLVMVEVVEELVANSLHLHFGECLVGQLQHCCLQD